jgi:hypothetical protein
MDDKSSLFLASPKTSIPSKFPVARVGDWELKRKLVLNSYYINHPNVKGTPANTVGLNHHSIYD